jgi:Zn-dependent protease with chaperone function
MNLPQTIPGDVPFPKLDAAGPPVDIKKHVEPKTGLAVVLGSIVLVIFILISIVIFYIAIALLFGLLVDYFRRKKALASLKGSSIEISEAQFPEIHACAVTVAQRVGLSHPPAIYLVQGNTLNASAIRLAGKQVVVLMDDTVNAALLSDEPRTLAFIIAHELAHHAFGHTKYFRSHLRTMMKWLSRLDEFSCDAVANEVVGDRTVSAKALTLLAAGPQLFRFVNTSRLAQQAQEVMDDKKSKKAEKHLTHPLLLRRLYRFIN